MKIICWSVAAVIVLAGGLIGIVELKRAAAQASASVLTYQVSAVTKGSVQTGVSGSGTLASRAGETITADYMGTVRKVYRQSGEEISAGETIAEIYSSELEEKLESLKSQLDSVNAQLARTSETASSKYITAPIAGTVKLVKAQAGDIVEEVQEKSDYLCVISTDDKMQVTFATQGEAKKYDQVLVTVDDDEVEGQVVDVQDGWATVEIEEIGYEVGTAAAVANETGEKLGEGTLELCNCVEVSADGGVIETVNKQDGDAVSQGTKLFTLADYPISSTYTSLKNQKTSLEEQIAELEQQKYVHVDYDGTITALPILEGDAVIAESVLASVKGNEGYDISVSVDELDIASISLGQSAQVTLDAVEGAFEGEVTYISYEGTASGNVTTYSVTVSTEAIEGALPGMSASCEITTDSSGDTTMVPAEALQTEGDETFVYLAAEGMAEGDEFAEGEVDLDSLQKVSVETGMSDGLYVAVTGELEEGDLIVVAKLTTTADGSASEETQMQMPEGMGGGMIQQDGAGMGGQDMGGFQPPSGNGQRPDNFSN